MAKWYVDKKMDTYTTFDTLTKAFLSFFQLFIKHDTDMKLFTNCAEPPPLTFLTTSMSGVADAQAVKSW